jgi:hypothetical protein
MLKQAAIMPRRAMSSAAKSGAKVAMERSKEILRNSSKNYKMKFEDGNTWEKKDIIRNLGVKLEKGKRKQKRVAQVTIRDNRVALYANFPEYGYEKKDGTVYPATHFMREGLTQTKRQVEDAMLNDIAKSLDKIKSK